MTIIRKSGEKTRKSFLRQILRIFCIKTAAGTVSEYISIIFADKYIKRCFIALPHFPDQEKIRIHMILLSRPVKVKVQNVFHFL